MDQVAEHSIADRRGNLGRYALHGEIAAGGMATVHLARLLGPVGFARTVAVKRLHPHLARDPDFVGMFLEEARLAARVRHPNVVSTLDVVSDDGELFLVMEYVAGESLSRLVRKTREAGKRVPIRHVIGIMAATLEGLHAAHEAKSERGIPLGIVHRDVSPQNIHVGTDGVTRVLDFGIAKATNRVQDTRTDQIKGKIAYMSPEQLAKAPVDRRADVYSASVVLWEAVTGHRLFTADDVPALVYAIVNEDVLPPSSLVPDVPKGLDELILRGLEREPSKRWSTAREMAEALERILPPSPARQIGQWVEEAAGEALTARQELVHHIESAATNTPPPGGTGLRLDTPSRPMEVASGVVKSESFPDAPFREPERATLLEGAVARARDDFDDFDDDDDDERETLVAAMHPSLQGPVLVSVAQANAQARASASPAPERRAFHAKPVLFGAAASALFLVIVMVVLAIVRSPEHETPEPAHAAPPPPAPVVTAPPAPTHEPESAVVLGGQRGATPTASVSATASAPPPRPTSMLAPVTKPRPTTPKR